MGPMSGAEVRWLDEGEQVSWRAFLRASRELVEELGDTDSHDLLGVVVTEFEKNNWFLRATLA